MSSNTNTGKSKGPIVNPALCRCCRSLKKCRLLSSEYDWLGKKEVYSEMFMDCFGLLLSNLDGDYRDSCICATCVVRLRDACAFRQQVLQCENIFLSATIEGSKEESVSKLEFEIKAEPLNEDSDSHMDDRDNHMDHIEHNADTKLNIRVKIEEDNVEAGQEAEKEPIKKPANMPIPKPANKPIQKPANKPIQKPANKTIKKPANKSKMALKRELYNKMQKLRDKLDQMLDKPASVKKVPIKLRSKTIQTKTKQNTNTPANEKKTQCTPKKHDPDHDHMIYSNAVTIATNSYVCPFLNRISIYYCYYCKDQFTNPNDLREHTLSHNPGKLFESVMEYKKIPKIDITRIDCRLCSEKIDDLVTFKSHITSVHGLHVYPVTNEFLTFRLSLDSVQCTECDSTFPYFDVLKKHMIDHFGKFVCDLCGNIFLEQNSLKSHIRKHNKVESNFPCEICGKNLKSKYSKNLHVKTIHEKKPIVNCYKCEASFLTHALRNRHLLEVHGDKRTFPCKLCDKVYHSRKILMEHHRRNHLKVYRHQCDFCDQRFYLPSSLKEHMATHTGERNFRCEFCDKSYPRLKSLQEHIRSHSNERRYKCDICNSTFTQKGSLKNHMKSHHQDLEMNTS